MKSICTFLFALLVLSYFIPEPTLGQSANLIEAAKKEGGKVIVYGSLQDSSMEPIGKAFQAKTGPIYRFAIVAVVYNKNVIKPGDIPKSLEDLLKPQFRGKLAMPDPTQD